MIGPNANMIVAGTNNLIQGNYVASVSSQGTYYFGIEERGASSDYNSFIDNQTTSTGFIQQTDTAVTIIGPNSVGSGNIVIDRPLFP